IPDEKFPNRIDQSVDIVSLCFDVDLETLFGRGLRCNWTDTRDPHSFWPGQPEREEIFYRGRARKSDQICSLVQKSAPRASNVACFRNCPICKTFIDYRPQLLQVPRKHVPRLFRSHQQDSQIFDCALLLKFPHNGLGHELRWLKIDMEMKIADTLRGRGPNCGDLHTADL